jgi:hypothetical protein
LRIMVFASQISNVSARWIHGIRSCDSRLNELASMGLRSSGPGIASKK